MYLANFTLAQFLAVFGLASAVALALYLLDRSRRKLVVSTLRFWEPAQMPVATARRRRIQDPWSLVLQLVSIALLLLAVAQLRLGAPAEAARDHVIVLDTSAWMGARSGRSTLMDVARQRARQYLRALPARDRVMLVRADALATPATAFEPDHQKVDDAIRASEAGATALNLDQALAFARRLQAQEGRRSGEIAFIGSGRISASESAAAPPRNLRVIPIADPVENCGLRKIGVRPGAASGTASGAPSGVSSGPGGGDTWEIYISAHNYGATRRTVTLVVDFAPRRGGRVPVGSEQLQIPAGGDAEATLEYRASGGGILGATLTPHDAFPLDDHAELELPAQPSLPVTVYSNQPELLEPVLSGLPRVAAEYRKPEQYRAGDRGLVILDRFTPPERPAADSIWIDPPAGGSPIPVFGVVSEATFAKWNSDAAVCQGLHAKDFKLERASVFTAGAGDTRIGEVASGPVIVARSSPGQPKMVVFGFHPVLSGMRYELATPLLFANLLRWIAPEVFRRPELAVGSVGAVKLALDQEPGSASAPDGVKVTTENGSPVPFTFRDGALNFFAGAPGLVRVVAGDREYRYSLTLPQLWDKKWRPPAEARQGVPRFAPVFDHSSDLWPWLALAGGAGLLAEWLWFGNARRSRREPRAARRVAGVFLLRRRGAGVER